MEELAEILLIEDNPGDQTLILEAFKESKRPKKAHIVSDGEEALSFLRREGNFTKVPRPHLVFLDLNLPKKDGREVLETIKKDEELRQIPVIVLTSSRASEDIFRSYDAGANCYLAKRSDLEEYLSLVQGALEFWLAFAELPENKE